MDETTELATKEFEYYFSMVGNAKKGPDFVPMELKDLKFDCVFNCLGFDDPDRSKLRRLASMLWYGAGLKINKNNRCSVFIICAFIECI